MNAWAKKLNAVDPVLRTGRVRKILPSYVEADGPNVSIGTLCLIEARSLVGPCSFHAEVVRVDRDSVILAPFEDRARTFSGALVKACEQADVVPVGKAFLGRGINALGQPIDGHGPIIPDEHHLLHGAALSPLERVSPREILETGVRAIDGLLTLGKGQRVGIFAASGVGKTSLLTQLAQQVVSDICILCLVGERGREVEAIWNQGLSDTARARATLVAATSDQSAAMRVRAAHLALALAEYWRTEGKQVLLLLDSTTRLAMAMREIGLAAGEPPTMRAYTPNVFSAIPKMVERCGALKSGGTITAIMTVLGETDDVDDPVCELMKSILDGHIVLSRSLSEQGHFPAIDVMRSVSRQAEGLVNGTHRRNALQVLEWLSAYDSSRTLIDTGLYAKGSNERLDKAIEKRPEITRFLRQERSERTELQATLSGLTRVSGGKAN